MVRHVRPSRLRAIARAVVTYNDPVIAARRKLETWREWMGRQLAQGKRITDVPKSKIRAILKDFQQAGEPLPPMPEEVSSYLRSVVYPSPARRAPSGAIAISSSPKPRIVTAAVVPRPNKRTRYNAYGGNIKQRFRQETFAYKPDATTLVTSVVRDPKTGRLVNNPRGIASAVYQREYASTMMNPANLLTHYNDYGGNIKHRARPETSGWVRPAAGYNQLVIPPPNLMPQRINIGAINPIPVPFGQGPVSTEEIQPIGVPFGRGPIDIANINPIDVPFGRGAVSLDGISSISVPTLLASPTPRIFNMPQSPFAQVASPIASTALPVRSYPPILSIAPSAQGIGPVDINDYMRVPISMSPLIPGLGSPAPMSFAPSPTYGMGAPMILASPVGSPLPGPVPSLSLGGSPVDEAIADLDDLVEDLTRAKKSRKSPADLQAALIDEIKDKQLQSLRRSKRSTSGKRNIYTPPDRLEESRKAAIRRGGKQEKKGRGKK